MAGTPVVTLEGVLVGAERRPYESFTTREGEKRPGGETFWIHVASTNGDGAPVAVKCKDAGAFLDATADATMFGPIGIQAELRASNSKIVHHYVGTLVTT